MNKRESFSSRWGFICACIGSAVGMGNIWMFPTRVSLYGGGSFLIPYFIFVILIGSTGVIGEMSFGRAAKAGPIDAFGIACEKKGKRKVGEALGMIPVFGSLAMAIGYTVVMGWILRYAVGTFTGATLSPENVDEFGAAFGKMASAFGNNIWQILALVACMLILMLGVGSGIEKANKIMMPIFFALFVILGIYVGFQPGASEGYRYIFRVDPKAFADPTTWIFALGQAFFSLSVAGNGTLIYGSYLSDEEDIPASAERVALFDTIAAIFAALVIIPAMATTGAQLDQGGPGLLFIFLPNLIKGMPGGMADRDHLLCRSIACRYDFADQSVRGSDCYSAGEVKAWKSSGMCTYGDRGSGRVTPDPGDCIRLDGRTVYLYLSARSRTCGNHVLLGMWQGICGKTGQYRERETICIMVSYGM